MTAWQGQVPALWAHLPSGSFSPLHPAVLLLRLMASLPTGSLASPPQWVAPLPSATKVCQPPTPVPASLPPGTNGACPPPRPRLLLRTRRHATGPDAHPDRRPAAGARWYGAPTDAGVRPASGGGSGLHGPRAPSVTGSHQLGPAPSQFTRAAGRAGGTRPGLQPGLPVQIAALLQPQSPRLRGRQLGSLMPGLGGLFSSSVHPPLLCLPRDSPKHWPRLVLGPLLPAGARQKAVGVTTGGSLLNPGSHPTPALSTSPLSASSSQ